MNAARPLAAPPRADAPPADAPLAGRRVAVTRPLDRGRGLADALAALGATVLAAPAITIAPPASYAALDACLARLAEYDWLALTSAEAAHAVADRLAATAGGGSAAPGRARVAVVGRATARAALARLGRVDLAPAEQTAEGLAAALAAALAAELAGAPPAAPAARVLFPCGDRAREALPAALRAAGVRVDRAVAYRTVPADLAPLAGRVLAGEVDAVLLASPSAADALVRALDGRAPPAVAIVCIGPTTADAARALGLAVAAVAAAPTDDALVEATRACLASTPPS